MLPRAPVPCWQADGTAVGRKGFRGCESNSRVLDGRVRRWRGGTLGQKTARSTKHKTKVSEETRERVHRKNIQGPRWCACAANDLVFAFGLRIGFPVVSES